MPFSLRNLKIRNQVLFLTLPLLLVLLGVVGLLFYNYWQINQINLSTEENEMAALRARSLLEGLREMDISVRGYASTGREVFLRGYGSAAQSVSQDLDGLRNLNTHASSTGSSLGTIRKDIEAWKSQCASPAIEGVKAGHSAKDVTAMLNGCGVFATVEKGIARFHEASRNAAAASRNNRQRAIHRALVSGVVLAVLFGVLLLLLVHFVSHSISDSVHQLIRASERLREGDFEPTLPPETQNEFGVLSRSFLHMAHALRQDREELGAIKRFSEAVTECTSESEVYDHILHALRDRFHPNQVIIFKLRPEEDFLEAVSSLNPLPEKVQEWPVIEGKHSCKAVRMGRSFRVNDVSVEPPCPSKFALPTEGSYYCAPLIAGGIIIGAVRLEGESGSWTPERESLLESYLSTSASVLSTLQLLQTMREQANIDPLTGLYNRRFCKDYARKLMAMARRKDTPLGFIMLDLDHFKEINDMYGHEVGDRILKQFARTVTQSMRETNLTARLGGEEFVVLLPDTGPSACQVVAERIRRAVAHMNMPQIKGKNLPQITVSLGIAVYPEHGGTLEEMLQSSDRALYESKRAGRNRATLYVEEAETTG
jgi:diguanylate cyclase (GGDEF)-like protein